MPIFSDVTFDNILITVPEVIPGDQEFTTAGTFTFTVPTGVTSVSVVCIGAGSDGTANANNSSFGSFCVAGGAQGITGGIVITGSGGPGGNGGTGTDGFYAQGGTGGNYGAGGGGGSNAHGGRGAGGGGVGIYGSGASGNGGSGGSGTSGGNGTNGGGGGGAGGNIGTTGQPGFGGSGGENGGPSSTQFSVAQTGGLYGAGGGDGGFVGNGGGGGAMAWTNNISVTPGQQITVIVANGNPTSVFSPRGRSGAVRVVWPGTSRQFPSTNVGA